MINIVKYSFPKDIVVVENPVDQKAILYNFNSKEKLEINLDALHLLEGIASGFDYKEIERSISNRKSKLQYETIKKFIDKMISKGWLIPSEIPNSYAKKILKTSPILSLIQWELTTKCNLHCLHCYNRSGENKDKDLSIKEIFDIIDQADELGVWQFDLTGGEMFLRDDIIDILEYFYKKRIAVRVASNGTLLTDEYIEKMKEYKVRSYATSIDGGSSESHDAFRGVKGSYNLALSNLIKVKESGIPIRRVNVTATKLNFHEMDDIEELYTKKLNVPYVVDNIVATGRGEVAVDLNVDDEQLINAKLRCFIATNGIDVAKSFLDNIGINFEINYTPPCGIFSYRLFITADGTYSVCPTLSPRENDIFNLGNHISTTIKDAWENATLWQKGLRNINCKNINKCKYGSICRGGCRSRAYLNTGKLDEPDYIMCNLMKKFEERVGSI